MSDYCDEINCESCYIPSYCAKYARLREEAERQSELVQREWLSPVEAAGLIKAAGGTAGRDEELCRALDALESVLSRFQQYRAELCPAKEEEQNGD